MNKEEIIEQIILDAVDSCVNDELICEYGMKPKRIIDKFGEVLDAIIDNLVCICLYPTNATVHHWKERACGLCKRFVDLDINPISKNTIEYRYKCFQLAVQEVLNDDFSALKNHFKTVSNFYANKNDVHQRLNPYKPYEDCYEENKEKIKDAIAEIINCIAKQDYNGIIQYISSF